MTDSNKHTSKANIILRALEPEDLEFLYSIENDTNYWYLSSITIPFSRYVLRQYIESAHLDIYTTKQLRLIVCFENDPRGLGAVDLYDFDPVNLRAGVGIYINEEVRHQSIGFQSLQLLIDYARNTLNLHQLFATIPENNLNSIKLFEKSGFIQCGKRADWLLHDGVYENALEFQFLL